MRRVTWDHLEVKTHLSPANRTPPAVLLSMMVLGAWLSGPGLAAAQLAVHDSHGDALRAVVSWDQVNGRRDQRSASIGFLLSTSESKYIPSYSLPDALINLLAENYTIDAAPGLDVRVVSVAAGPASIRLGDMNDINFGIGVRATIEIYVPKDLPHGTRSVVLTFPNAPRARDLAGAVPSDVVPTITFRITNFASEEARAAARWWRWLLLGVLCLVGAVLASSAVGAFENEGCGLVLVAGIGLWVGALTLLGRGVQDLSTINTHAVPLVAGAVAIPLILGLLLVPDAWPVGAGATAALAIVALLCRWQGWVRGELGAVVILPGAAIGTAATGLRRLRRLAEP